MPHYMVCPDRTVTAGKFTTSLGARRCEDCEEGRWQGALICRMLMSLGAVGRYANGTGNTACRDCPLNTRALVIGQEECEPCPDTQFTLQTAQKVASLPT